MLRRPVYFTRVFRKLFYRAVGARDDTENGGTEKERERISNNESDILRGELKSLPLPLPLSLSRRFPREDEEKIRSGRPEN